ncbi:MAG TPA: PilC/PilY family type IV pilus protein [Casimicrobiaceae bacterium]|nr:PilC/PilY family type IV pilus protein [Casimicrobiaceae bacterium]
MNIKKAIVAATCAVLAQTSSAALLTLAQYPLFLTHKVLPNVLVIYDNSESMDGTMAGKLIAGDDPTTRGNTARTVIRNTINSYSSLFNWGLETFYVNWPWLAYTYPYWIGNEQTMVFTDDCVPGGPNGGISASNNGLRCIPNPQPFPGGNYVTYDIASDDPNVNDVLYVWYIGTGAWATTCGGTSYSLWTTHLPGPAWDANMTDLFGWCWGFTPTDAGFLPINPPYTREMYALRAWGFYSDVNGFGNIIEPVMDSGASGHLNNLMTALANETQYGPDIKNSAVFTPLAGSFNTAQQYFSGGIGASPIAYSCQKNFILLATDGNPTATMYGWDDMYPLSLQQNVYNPVTQTWTFSQAANDLFAQVKPLRNFTFNSNKYDIQTYVVGMGDTVANPGSIATLNQTAYLGGTNAAYLASDTAALAAAFQAIAVDIESKTAAASAVSLNTGSWGTGTNLYQARFNSGDWSGQLIDYIVNQDGSLGTQVWDAGQVINAQNWSSGRTILTYKPSAALGSRGIAFRWPASYPGTPLGTEMDNAQAALLNSDMSGNTDGFGPQRVQWIRGNPANEGGTCGTCTPLFRSRPTSKLGDIIHSAPSYVAAPAFGYPDSMESAPYSAFAGAYASRPATIYVGANDGMLHAFDANTGAEVMAYVPALVYRNLSALTTQSLSANAGDPTPHRYTVDGSPTVGDVFYGGAWHTVLAGALAAGGQGVYLLDVTNPKAFSEAGASATARWEFNDASDADLGYVFAQPLLVKTNNGRWSVIVGNGYNNSEADGHASTTGHAVLYVLDAETGAMQAKIDTGVGSVGTPDGLSGAIAVDTNGDGTADVVYAGDLFGNMWKFDLTSANAGSWNVAFGGAPLFSTGGQPITTRPDVTAFVQGGYLVTFGTGRYIDASDNSTTDLQTFYGIRDNGVAVSGLSSLVRQSVAGTATGADGNTYRITTHAVGPPTLDTPLSGDNIIAKTDYYATKSGWYLNLPLTGERVAADPTIRAGRVVFTTLIPNTDPCGYGGSGWVMEVDVMTGNRYDTPTFDTNGDDDITNADLVSYLGSPENTSGRATSSVPAAPGFLSMKPGKSGNPYANKYVNTSSGSVNVVGESDGVGLSQAGRASWRQIQ